MDGSGAPRFGRGPRPAPLSHVDGGEDPPISPVRPARTRARRLSTGPSGTQKYTGNCGCRQAPKGTGQCAAAAGLGGVFEARRGIGDAYSDACSSATAEVRGVIGRSASRGWLFAGFPVARVGRVSIVFVPFAGSCDAPVVGCAVPTGCRPFIPLCVRRGVEFSGVLSPSSVSSRRPSDWRPASASAGALDEGISASATTAALATRERLSPRDLVTSAVKDYVGDLPASVLGSFEDQPHLLCGDSSRPLASRGFSAGIVSTSAAGVLGSPVCRVWTGVASARRSVNLSRRILRPRAIRRPDGGRPRPCCCSPSAGREVPGVVGQPFRGVASAARSFGEMRARAKRSGTVRRI